MSARLARTPEVAAPARRPPADVVVVGLGATGGVAVLPLAHAGLRVVALEAGGRLGRDDFVSDEIRNHVRNHMGAKANAEVPTARLRSADTARRPSAPALMMNGVGGTSVGYTGHSWRYLPWNFRSRSDTIRRYGAQAIPSGSTLADWPLSYEDLAPYYDRVERLLGVSGVAGANPFEGPRDTEYPLPPLRRTGWTDLMTDAARRLGWHPFPGPAAIRSQPYRELPACTYCGFCAANGCHVDAKGSTSLSGIPEAVATGNLEIFTNAAAVEVATRRDGRATGVAYVADGVPAFQPAAVVLLAAYAYENVRLLLTSRSGAHPAGVGNRRGQVGRHFTAHSYFPRYGLFPGRRLNRFSGTGSQWTAVDDFDADNFDHTGLGFVGGGSLSAAMEARPLATAQSTPPNVPRWGSGYTSWLRANANSVGAVYAEVDVLPYETNYLDLDSTARDSLGRRVIRATFDFGDNERAAFAFIGARLDEWLRAAGASETWGPDARPQPVSTHAFGGARMGEDPATSVVDPWGMVHDAPNVGVLGTACMPTSGGRGPTETAQALAWRTADHVVARLGGHPRDDHVSR